LRRCLTSQQSSGCLSRSFQRPTKTVRCCLRTNRRTS